LTHRGVTGPAVMSRPTSADRVWYGAARWVSGTLGPVLYFVLVRRQICRPTTRLGRNRL